MNRRRKQSDGRFFRIILWLLFFGLLGAGGWMVFKDTNPPMISIQQEPGFIPGGTEFTVHMHDPASGIEHISITALRGEGGADSTVLLEETMTVPEQELISRTVSLPASYPEGTFTLVVQADDASYYPMGEAGHSEARAEYTLDATAPTIRWAGHQLNMTQGGSGLVLFTVNETPERTGVMVGDFFFPAYKQQSGQYACLFAEPYDVSPQDFNPTIIAEDAAGNTGSFAIPHHANARDFPHDRINIPDSFLDRKMPQFASLFPNAQSNLELFLTVNTNLRGRNRAQLQVIGHDTADELLCSGPFKALPNAAARAGFGDNRTYYYNNNAVDYQTHLGVDLASIRQAPVPAGNDGIVVYAGFYGIYGNCVIIDHGLGLQSLYSHLTTIDVAVNQNVERGQTIGTTGETGMAGGDHLHFGMIVSGMPVNPLEWWDATWIRNNIESKLQ